MAQDEQTGFDLDPAKNDLLYLERGRPHTRILVIVGLLAFMIWLSAQILDPNWNPRYVHGKGAWIVALFALMPLAVRAAILAVTTGWIAEAGYRVVIRSFDG